MKKVTLWVSIALLTFFIGVACVFLRFADYSDRGRKAHANTVQDTVASSSELPELSFCQLVAKAEDYEGKVVRVRAHYSFGIHGATFGDESCASADNITWLSLSRAMWDEMDRATESAYGTKRASDPLDIIAVGKFERNNPSHSSDTWADRATFRFDLQRIEKVGPVY